MEAIKVKTKRVSSRTNTISMLKNTALETVHLDAVAVKPFDIRFISKPSEKVQILAVSIQAAALKYIKSPTYNVVITALKQSCKSVKYIAQNEKMIDMVAEKHPELLMQLA